jgi:hypothetical protein
VSNSFSITGNGDKSINAPSVFDNSGTINQSGSGNVVFYASPSYPAVLNNLSGGVYDLQSDSGFVFANQQYYSGGGIINNAGLFRKSGGSGVSIVGNELSFNNTGTVEVDSGTLEFDSTISQLSGDVLTGGVWKVYNNATLALPGNITNNQGAVTLSGTKSNFSAFNALANNQGSFSLLNGRVFNTGGDLQNGGSLTIGEGSNLSVNGNLSLLNGGSLMLEIGGLVLSTDDGTIAVAGSVSLGGALVLSFANDFQTQVLGDETFTLLTAGDPTVPEFERPEAESRCEEPWNGNIFADSLSHIADCWWKCSTDWAGESTPGAGFFSAVHFTVILKPGWEASQSSRRRKVHLPREKGLSLAFLI